MNYEAYKRHSERVRFLEQCMARVSVRLIEEENKLEESQRIGFMAKKKMGNPNLKPGPGRPKGLPNKKTRELIEKVEWVLDLLEGTLEEDIKKLKPAERARMWEALQEYIRPKLQRSEIKADVVIIEIFSMY